MRIINLNGGGGGTFVNSDNSGLFKMTHHVTGNDMNTTTVIDIYDENDPSTPRPKEIAVFFNGRAPWNPQRDENKTPPNPGTAFGIKIFKGDDVPKSIYVRSFASNPKGFDYGNKDRYSQFATDSRFKNTFGLPNAPNANQFDRVDCPAADAKTHHLGEWDFIANGGNGKFTSYTDGIDSCGSNGSMFGDGKTSDGAYPSSCGNPGTDSERGKLAHGIEYNSAFDSFKSILSFAEEVDPTPPTGSNINNIGGNGHTVFNMTQNVEFGMANGVPFTPFPTKILLTGGHPVVGRTSRLDQFSCFIDILHKY